MPMIDQYETILTNIEEQIFARCCIDIIGKQCRATPKLYFVDPNLVNKRV